MLNLNQLDNSFKANGADINQFPQRDTQLGQFKGQVVAVENLPQDNNHPENLRFVVKIQVPDHEGQVFHFLTYNNDKTAIRRQDGTTTSKMENSVRFLARVARTITESAGGTAMDDYTAIDAMRAIEAVVGKTIEFKQTTNGISNQDGSLQLNITYIA